MARRPVRLSPEARREEILAAALACFSKTGYHGTTIDDIAESAGLSKGAVYWHFANKRELFLALIDAMLERFGEEFAAPGQASSARERLEHVCQVVLSVDPGAPGMADLQAEFLAHAVRDEALRGRLAKQARVAVDPVIEAVAQGVRSGEFRRVDPERVAFALLAIVDGLQNHQLLLPELDVNAIFREGVELLIRGLEAKG